MTPYNQNNAWFQAAMSKMHFMRSAANTALKAGDLDRYQRYMKEHDEALDALESKSKRS